MKVRRSALSLAACLAAALLTGCEVDNPNYMPFSDVTDGGGEAGGEMGMMGNDDLGAAFADLRAGAGDMHGTASDLAVTAPDMAVTAADACDAYAKAVCDRRSTCNPFLFKIDYPDMNKCVERALINCAGRFSLDGVKMVPAHLKDCASAYKAMTCDDHLMGNLPSACRFKGSLDNTNKCGDSAQCKSGYCLKPNPASCGQCSDRVGAGSMCSCDVHSGGEEDCSQTACDYGLYCPASFKPGGGKCATPSGSGGACSQTQPCKPTLACPGSGNAGAKCSAALVKDAACIPQDVSCDELNGLSCVPVTGPCKAIPTASAGNACPFAGGFLTQCLAGAYCDGTSCIAPAADKATCNAGPGTSGAGPGCLQPAYCPPAPNNKCTILDPAACK